MGMGENLLLVSGRAGLVVSDIFSFFLETRSLGSEMIPNLTVRIFVKWVGGFNHQLEILD